MQGYVLINETTRFPDLTRDKCLALAAALARQEVEVAAYWQRTPLEVLFADSEAAAPQEDGWTLAKAVDTLEDKGALAYHTELRGRPSILMGAQIIQQNAAPGSDWVLGPDSFSTATSHELPETTGNPYVAFYVPLDANIWIPLEMCDPVQGDSYKDEETGIYLSNFVTPRYFGDGDGPYDRMGLVKAPKEIRPGGYQQQITGGPGGASQAVFGALPHEGGMPVWKRIAKAKAGTRFAKSAARATGTDIAAELAKLREDFVAQKAATEGYAQARDEELAEIEQLRTELAFHKDAGAILAKAHDEKVAEIEQLRAMPRHVGNGGHGG